MRVVLVMLGLGVLGGCGGDGASGDPIAPSEATSLCQQFADHASGCGWGGNINGTDWNCAEAALVWREDVFRMFADCAIALPCDGDGAACYAELATEVAPLPIHDDYADRCRERAAACELAPAGDASTRLLTCDPDVLDLYARPIVEDVIACFELPCPEVVACLEQVL